MGEDKLVFATDVPDVQLLVEELKNCTPWSDGNWNRVADNENTRFTRWPGQSPDGKKHDQQTKPAFPFDGASDTRIPLADAIVNENVAVCCAAFWRAMIRPKFGKTEESQYAVALADHFINEVMYEDLVREVELSEQYRSTLGWVILHPTWEREVCMAYRKIELRDIVQLAMQAADQDPNSPLAKLPEMIETPEADDETAKIFQTLYSQYAAQQIKNDVEVDIPDLPVATLKKAIDELRQEGETQLPVPYVSKNQPAIYALKPWDDVFVSNACTDVKWGPRVYRRIWMDEVELRSNILTQGWSEEWVEEALKHKGKYSTWLGSGVTMNPPTILADAMSGQAATSFQQSNQKEELVEVFFATYRALDENNVQGVYTTVFHVAVVENAKGKPLYAEHGLEEGSNGLLPYVSGQRENWSRTITNARGVPQIAGSWQREIKVQRDGLVDHTSLGVTPPLMVPKGAMGMKFIFAPAKQNEVTPGREPKFLDVDHTGTPVAMEVLGQIEKDCDNYFGRLSEDVPPPRTAVKQEMLVRGFLTLWTKSLQMVLTLAQRYMPDAEFSRVTGAPAGWLDERRYAYGSLDVGLHFDVRELDPDYVKQQLEVINTTVLPGDVAGVIDRAKYTMLQLRSINPVLANELVSNPQQASQKIFKDVQTDVAMMFLGNEAQYVEMDPTAATKLQYLQQVLQSNPNYQQALQQKSRFAELVQKYSENLQFSITEEQNKQVGAIGVKPENTGMQGGGQGMPGGMMGGGAMPGMAGMMGAQQ